MKDSKIYFCGSCNSRLYIGGWGRRVECPHCEKWVNVKVVTPKQTLKKGGKR